MKTIPCNICGGTKTEPLFHKGPYQLVKCPSCGLAYINPQPEPDDLRDYYQGHYGACYIQNKKKTNSKLWDARREIWRLKSLQKPASPCLLDVGCSFGFILKVAADAGWTAVGIDPSQWAVEYAKNQLQVDARQGDLLSFDGKNGSFDFITIYDVIEHTLDPVKNLKRAYALLKPGGYLVIGVPDFGHYKARRAGPDWGPFIPPEHLFYFSAATLPKLCEAAGFEHVKFFFRFPNRETLKAAFRKPVT